MMDTESALFKGSCPKSVMEVEAVWMLQVAD